MIDMAYDLTAVAANAEVFVRTFLAGYLEPAFGARSKTEIDLLVFGCLIDAKVVDPDGPIYDIARGLNITPSRARSLVLNWQLRAAWTTADLVIAPPSQELEPPTNPARFTLLASHTANDARLKSAAEFGRSEMGGGSELYQSVLRAVLYALMELEAGADGAEVLVHLTLNVPNYYGDITQRERVVELADYLAKRLEQMRPAEASAARVLRELVKNQRLG
jgi:hypothetical protein